MYSGGSKGVGGKIGGKTSSMNRNEEAVARVLNPRLVAEVTKRSSTLNLYN